MSMLTENIKTPNQLADIAEDDQHGGEAHRTAPETVPTGPEAIEQALAPTPTIPDKIIDPPHSDSETDEGPAPRKNVTFSVTGNKRPHSHGSVPAYYPHAQPGPPHGAPPHNYAHFGGSHWGDDMSTYGGSIDGRTLVGSSPYKTSDLPAGFTPSWPSQTLGGYTPQAFSTSSPYVIPPPIGPSPYWNLYSIGGPPSGFKSSYGFSADYDAPVAYESAVQDAALWFLLLPKVLVGAGLDSAVRYPLPRCHPATRRTLRGRIAGWLADRSTNLLWLYGPAGVGKSAIAQTVAEDCRKEGWLGAAFFFSRSRGSDDPNRVIPSLVAQLFVTFPAYKALVSPLIIANPAILEHTLDVQFQKLIVEPLLQLKDRRLRAEPLLFLLDGLDECRGDTYQQQLIRLIAKFAALLNISDFPFVWIVTSRSEWHIRAEFYKFQCLREELVIDTPEAREDASILLRDGFAAIRNKYSNMFSKQASWPAEKQLSVIHSSVSGFIAIASSILQFIDTHEIPNPLVHLETSLSYLETPSLSMSSNPLDSVFMLYREILDSIPSKVLPITKKILFFLVLHGRNLPTQILANVLFIDQATFYASLYRLHSVLIIPSPEIAGELPMTFYHSSFLIFLENFYMNQGGTVIDPYPETYYVQWCKLWGWMGSNFSRESLLSHLSWPGELILDNLLKFVSSELWRVWGDQVTEATPRFYRSLCHFNFAIHQNTGLFSQSIWADPYHPTPFITDFLYKLDAWQARGLQISQYDILRKEPSCSTDQHLIHEYGHLINYQGMIKADFSRVLSDPTGWSYVCLSLEACSTGLHDFSRVHKALSNPHPMYFLLGYDTNTCLMIMYRPMMEIQQFFQGAFRQIQDLHSDDIGGNTEWPTKENLEQLVLASEIPQELFDQAYLPSLARTIVAFVGHPDHLDPVGRLKWVMEILDQNHDPMEFLELLYSRSLSDIPQGLHLITNRILAFLVCYGTRSHSRGVPTKYISRFIGLAEGSVRRVLRLASLILSSRPLPFPIDAVSDFDLSDLLERVNDGLTYMQCGSRDEQAPSAISSRTWLEVSVRYIYWCDHILSAGVTSMDKLVPDGYPIEREINAEVLFRQDLLAGGHWIAFSKATEETASELIAELRHSRFFRMMALHCGFQIAEFDDMAIHFGLFVNGMYLYQIDLDSEDCVVRVDRNCDTDDELLGKWKKPDNICRKATFPIDITSVTCYFTISQTNWAAEAFADGVWNYFWLGYGVNTCLVTFQQDEDEI